MTKANNCIYCKSENVIKHGKTRSGDPRYRCKDCEKTWVKGIKLYKKPDISAIAESYLLGFSIRDLVPFFKSSHCPLMMKRAKQLKQLFIYLPN